MGSLMGDRFRFPGIAQRGQCISTKGRVATFPGFHFNLLD
jgi:hypothetical protein